MLLAADNQNNAGTGVSNTHFRVNGNYTAANPFEADLAVSTENTGMVRLRIRATDIESQATDPAGVGSIDQVYVNDVLVGMLAQGADNATGDTIVLFDSALLASGTARVRIQNANTNTVCNMTVQDVELTLEKTGDDLIDGGAGVDQLVGGRGDDVYIVGEERHSVQEQAGQGSDTVLSAARMFTLGAGIETLGTSLPAREQALTVEAQIDTDIVAATQHPRSVTVLNDDDSVGAGAPTILRTTTAGDQLGPSVAALDFGRPLVIWELGESGGKVFRGRIIDADGTPSGNDFLISAPGGETPDSGEVRAQVTAINGGGFAVVWGITNEIVGRVFDSTGAAIAPQFTVNQRTDGAQTTVAITRLAEGGFMAAWTSDNGQDGDVHGVVARLFNGDGSARGDDFVVNQVGTRFQLFPELATLQDGRIVAVFSSDIPGSGSDYEGRQSILDTTPDQTPIGNELASTVTAGTGDDVLAGSDGGDTMLGGAGNDSLDGGAIEANSANGAGTNAAFTLIGGAAFSNVAGQLRSELISGNTFLIADTKGDGIADLWLRLDGVVTVGAGDPGL